MKAIHIGNAPDAPLRWEETPPPHAGPGEVRIRVVATAVNRADLMQRKGLYPPPPGASPILGLEASGIIDEVGEGVTQWRCGDAVCALLSGGGYAEYVVVPQQQLPCTGGSIPSSNRGAARGIRHGDAQSSFSRKSPVACASYFMPVRVVSVLHPFSCREWGCACFCHGGQR